MKNGDIFEKNVYLIDKIGGTSTMQNKKSFLFCIVFDLHYLCSKNILAVEVRPTYEFTQLILSFGKDVEVLKPKW